VVSLRRRIKVTAQVPDGTAGERSFRFLVKRLVERDGHVLFAPENDDYEELEINDHHFEVWGVVTSIIHAL
jgi:SOS-response transcriptional repressor LexA